MDDLVLSTSSADLLSKRYPERNLSSYIRVEGRVVACGGYRDVVNGTDLRNGDNVAVMRFRSFVLRKAGRLGRDKLHSILVREAEVWFGLDNPNVLPLRGYILEEGNHFPSLVTEWMNNGTLTRYLQTVNVDIKRVITEVFRGIQYLHSKEVIQRISNATISWFPTLGLR